MKFADLITNKIFSTFYQFGDIIVPGCSCGFQEVDVMRVLATSQYVYEYEVKVSRSDFRADFKKTDKHQKMVSGESFCNRFFFVVPDGLVNKNEVPSYAGLIYADKYGHLRIVKPAKMLHKRTVPIEWYKRLAYTLSFREHTAKSRLRYVESKLKEQKSIA
jgi:hypothetical protein